MRPAVLGTSQLYYLIAETLVTSLFFFNVFRNVFFKTKTSKIRYEETPAFLRFFSRKISFEVEFLYNHRVIKNGLIHLARGTQ